MLNQHRALVEPVIYSGGTANPSEPYIELRELANGDNYKPLSDRMRAVIPEDVWRDLGAPTLLTLTIEAGDTINQESDND